MFIQVSTEHIILDIYVKIFSVTINFVENMKYFIRSIFYFSHCNFLSLFKEITVKFREASFFPMVCSFHETKIKPGVSALVICCITQRFFPWTNDIA